MADGTGFAQHCNEDAKRLSCGTEITVQTCSGLRIEPLVLYPYAVTSDISELMPSTIE